MAYKDLKNRLDLLEKFYLNRNYVSPGTPDSIPHALTQDEWAEVKEYELLEAVRSGNAPMYTELLQAWALYFEKQKHTPAAYKKRYLQECFKRGDMAEVKRVAAIPTPTVNLPTPSPYDPLWLRSGAHSVQKYKRMLEKAKQLRIELGFDEDYKGGGAGSVFD